MAFVRHHNGCLEILHDRLAEVRNLLHLLALFAGVAVEALGSRWPSATRILAGVASLYLYVQTWTAERAICQRPAEPVGLCAYRRRSVRHPGQPQNIAIDVYSGGNSWPLPWYLRRLPNMRWWRQVAVPGSAAPIPRASANST
jgi:hypothetical protein